MSSRIKLYNRYKGFDGKVVSFLGANFVVNQEYSYQARYYNNSYKEKFKNDLVNVSKFAKLFTKKGYAMVYF